MKKVALAIGTILILGIPAVLISQFTLDNVEKEIAREHPVSHLPVEHLVKKLASPDSSAVMLFDVRKEEEYRVSHLKNAIRIDPEMSGEAFLKQYGKLLENKQAVFYCSVGKRSSIMVERVKSVLNKLQTVHPRALYNLRGGIFRWYNNGYPVYNDSTETDSVHPFNKIWGQLLQKRKTSR